MSTIIIGTFNADLERLKEMGVNVDEAFDMGFVTTESELGFA